MKKILTFILTCLILASCNTKCLNKEGFISGYEKFNEDVKTHYRELKESDWTSIDKEFKIYVEQCYPKFKAELSLGEKVDFWKNTISYGIYRGKNDDSYEFDLDLDLEAEFNEISAQGRQEIEDFIKNEIAPDLENAVDDVLKEVENLGNKIKEWLNEQ